jgi:hypothetical protein
VTIRLGSATALLSLALALSVVPLGGCKKPPPPTQQQSPPGPPDHLAPGELVEGKDRAFALPLPRSSEISMKTPTSVHVATPYNAEQLANFVRARIKQGQGRVTVGASSTTFDDVIVQAEPSRHLQIAIVKGPRLSEIKSTMTVQDVTPPPPPDPNTTEEERWKKAGLKPNGQVLDPKHLQ